jgi:phosphate transport system permease protein
MDEERRMTTLADEAAIGRPREAVVRPSSLATFDRVFRFASYASAVLVLLVLLGIIGSMIYGGLPAFREFGFFGFLTSSTWDVNNDQYGAWPAVAGTLASAGLALLIGVPISLGIAVYLTQLSPGWLKGPFSTAIELLAAVPSIIYGMWGLFVFAPLFARFVQVPVSNLVEGLPVVGTLLYARVPSGVGILTAGIILALMIIPFIASVTRDMLDQIPTVLRESAYGIGCTTWEVVRHVLVPQAGVSIIGAIMLGLGRALGETMAVTFVVGNANRLSGSIFDPGSTIASRIANEFNEAIGMQLNALIALGCILFLVTFGVLVVARLLVARVKVH